MKTPLLLGYITFPGLPEMVPGIRHYTRRLLGPEHSAADDVELLVSEVVSNAIRHTESGHGGTVSVAVTVDDHRIRIEVLDDGTTNSRPQVQTDAFTESGHGLYLVQQIAAAWGVTKHDGHPGVWFEVPF